MSEEPKRGECLCVRIVTSFVGVVAMGVGLNGSLCWLDG